MWLPGALVVVGWTLRLMQRGVLKTWWRLSPLPAGDVSFEQFLLLDPSTAALASWPNWCLGQTNPEGGLARRLWIRCTGSLWLNVRKGVQAMFNTWVVTLPAGFLWASGWYFGWQNSFNKGYENAPYGPVTFILGMLWFSVAMIHVPLGLARQASTGDWRRFYDFRILWCLSRRRWLATLALAGAWAGATALAILLKTGPQYFAGYGPHFADVTDVEAFQIARRFYWVSAWVLFPLYVGIRLLAARIYARGLVEAYQLGVLGEDAFAENEWHALRRLGLLTPRHRPRRHILVRVAAWLATRSGRLVAVSTVFGIWFALSFFNLVGEFFARTEYSRGWWNQSMIHLPWFDYTPQHLREAARKSDQKTESGGPGP